MIATLEELQFLQKMPVKGKYAVAPKLVGLAITLEDVASMVRTLTTYANRIEWAIHPR
ncbi:MULTISPECIES: hypothetical protein [Variovorax]|uniref:hypothetical protein n=1 Tax=Variovorax TaxID=34072 RepID=UPI0021ACDDB8|nr:hypothetical protein [Variovorax paradoxus]UVH58364.1 hypothetical protein NWF24_02835 [Variovorax paradoxus]